MIKVTLREKPITKGRLSLYLDFYPAIIDPETGQDTRREFLRIYVQEKPKGEIERDLNKELRMIAEGIRARRQLEVQEGSYGFSNKRNKQKNFNTYFAELVESKKQTSKSNYENWQSVFTHFKAFAGETRKFGDVTENFCAEFRSYLLNHERLSINTAAYFDKFKTAVKEAYKQKLFPENPAANVKSIPPEETEREFLTLSELKKLSVTPLKDERLRCASLFSALTGLRFIDVSELIWSEIQYSEENGHYIRFKDIKTKHAQTQYFNDEAFELLGERKKPTDKVFEGLLYSHCTKLAKWVTDAGITKKITFHCFRHTFATLQITFGTDIYVICNLLGHKDVRTTQIYAKIVDEKKREAANKISLK